MISMAKFKMMIQCNTSTAYCPTTRPRRMVVVSLFAVFSMAVGIDILPLGPAVIAGPALHAKTAREQRPLRVMICDVGYARSRALARQHPRFSAGSTRFAQYRLSHLQRVKL